MAGTRPTKQLDWECSVTELKVIKLQYFLHQWSRWMGQSTVNQIFGAWLTVGLVMFLCSIISMGKELVVAARFGRGDDIDAFLIAFLPIMFVISVIINALRSTMIPAYIQTREQHGREAAQFLISTILTLAIVLLIAIILILALSAPYFLPILSSGFDDEKSALTQKLFYLMLPILIIRGVSMIWSSMLNAEQRFILPEAALIAVPLFSIIALIMWSSDFGIYALVIGTVGGFLLDLLVLGFGLRQYRGVLIPRWRGKIPILRHMIGQYMALITASFLMSSTILIDGAMAASLASGSVSALNYGNKLTAVIANIGAGAIGVVVLPIFSKLMGTGDYITVRRILKMYSFLILFMTLPVVLILLYFSEPLIQVLFERGEFKETDVQIVGMIQAVHGLYIPFYILGILFVRLISSVSANHILIIGSFMNLILKAILNYYFTQYWDVMGIALSTVCVYIFSFGFLAIVSYRIILKTNRPSR